MRVYILLLEMDNRDQNNPKRRRFLKLATYRTNEILRKLKILGHCANRSAYEYSEDDVNKIFSEIDREFKSVRSRFSFPAKKKKFSLTE